jgi:Ca-activated chloride channel family protein
MKIISRRSHQLFLTGFAISLACLVASPASAFGGVPYCAQQQTPATSATPITAQTPVLRSSVDVQTVDVHVKDKQGNDVTGLTAKDFTVLEDRKQQTIAFFDAGAAPVTVAVLVDSSASMETNAKLGSAEQIAAKFMRTAHPGDDVYAMDFTESIGPFEHLTLEQLKNPAPIRVEAAGGSGSAVYDAIAAAVCHLRDSKNPRQAIIVITDRVDQHSRINLDELVDLVRSQRAQLFLIGVPSRREFGFSGHIDPKLTLVTGHDIDNPDFVFDRLVKDAGAQTFTPKSEEQLQDALKSVSEFLGTEYTLAYYPPPTSRKFRKLEVKVDRPGVRVVSSRSVVRSGTSEEIVRYVEGTCVVSPEFFPFPYEAHISNGANRQVYRDDFSDPLSGWPQHPESHYVSGGYELSTLKRVSDDAGEQDSSPRWIGRGLPGGAGSVPGNEAELNRYRDNLIAAYGPPWPNFRVSASVKPVFEHELRSDQQSKFSVPVRAAVGLVFRINLTGYYALLVSPSAGNKKSMAFELVARTFRGDSFAESVLVPWTTVEAASPLRAQLAVEDVGDQITIYMDGKEVETVRDETFDYGYAGFIVSAPARAVFSDLLIEEM